MEETHNLTPLNKEKRNPLLSVQEIRAKILHIRNTQVMLDSDLAELYGVETKMLNRAVKRNIDRFPEDFMFQLTEAESLRCQIGTSKEGRGGRRYLPYAFTEEGVAMLSSVLRSEPAVAVNILIMRAFVQIRRWAFSYEDLSKRIDALEKKFDENFAVVFKALKTMLPKPTINRKIGFRRNSEKE